jgi:FlaA1/EpsC-like NDP-sugar epimerase
MWREQRPLFQIKLAGAPILIIGAGDTGYHLSKELRKNEKWYPIGFVDDSQSKQGAEINGVKVLGKIEELPHLSERLGFKHAAIAMPSAPHQQRKRALDICTDAQVQALIVPSFDDLMHGRIAVSHLRQVELDDLLGRDPVVLDEAGLHQLLADKAVLVTGAGGSIGSELCRQIAQFQPKCLLLFDSSEFALYNIEQQMIQTHPTLNKVFLAGDVRDTARLNEIFSKWHPEVVFHAAAYKHVPLMEHANAWQAVRTNVYGTWCVTNTAKKYGVEKFVLISTDKAVNPTNVMGATKRLAEMVCQGQQSASGTRFITVRFGNVLGSNGSVIPKFREQISKGGPVTVTHPEITRYFMSIPEAAQLVLQAGLMGQGKEIFVLEMGAPVKIVNLAKELIHLSGFSEADIQIKFTGLRPGEKLYEELLADNENTLPTPHEKLRVAKCRELDDGQLNEILEWISNKASYPSDTQVRSDLHRWVPEYTPTTHGRAPQ